MPMQISHREVDYIAKVMDYDFEAEAKSYDLEHPDEYGKHGQPLNKGHIYYYIYRVNHLVNKFQSSLSYQYAKEHEKTRKRNRK